MPLEDPPRLPHGKNSFHPNRRRKKPPLVKPSNIRWAVTIVGWTFVISVTLSFVSTRAMRGVSVFAAFFILLCFIAMGIIFDILGLAIVSASEKPFHSMASRRVSGSLEALKLVRRADRVANFCNDVVGDISGIISGATSAAIVARIAVEGAVSGVILPLAVSGLVAAITVGGKALGKTLAITKSTEIVLLAGRLIYTLKAIRRKLFPKHT